MVARGPVVELARTISKHGVLWLALATRELVQVHDCCTVASISHENLVHKVEDMWDLSPYIPGL